MKNVTVLFVIFKSYILDSRYITMRGRTYYLRDLAHVGYGVAPRGGGVTLPPLNI